MSDRPNVWPTKNSKIRPNMKSKNDYENYNFSLLQNDAKIIAFLIRFN